MYTYRQIWKVSYPIIIGLIAQNIMLVIDTAFLGRVSEVTLGAAAIGGVFYLSLVMLATGFSVGAQIMIGRRNGAENYAAIGRIFNHTQIFLIILAILIWSILQWLAPAVLSKIIQSEAILKESIRFIEYRKFGLFFGFIVLGFNALYVGSTKTRVLIISTLVMSVFNIICDYLLIFGHYGFPKLGIGGAALATNIAEFVTFIFYLTWTLLTGNHRRFHLKDSLKIDFQLFGSLVKLAAPVMIQYFLSFSAWFVFFLIIEKMGETALAASNITRSIYMVFMIPVWGLAASVNTLVSNTIGRGETDKVMTLIWRMFAIGLAISVVIIQITLYMPGWLARLYTTDPDLIAATIPLLRVISFALLAFSFGMIFFSGLSGTGKTFLALKIEIATISLYLLSAYLLANFTNATAPLVWTVEIIYFTTMGIFALWMLRRGGWRGHTI